MQMSIADVLFDVSSESQFSMEAPGGAYRSFLGTPRNASGLITFPVSAQLDRLPSTEGMREVFRSGTWSMFSNMKKRLVTFALPETGEMVWGAEFDMNAEQATVYFGESIVKNTPSGRVVENRITYPLDQILLMYILGHREGALVHSAGIAIKGKGLLFPGRSGAGKSTISRLFDGHDDILVFSDDRTVVRKISDEFRIYGTPWHGDAGKAEQMDFPLNGIFFIRQDKDNRIERIRAGEAAERLLPVTSIPWYDETAMSGILRFCEDIITHIPCYELRFRPGNEVVGLIEDFAS